MAAQKTRKEVRRAFGSIYASCDNSAKVSCILQMKTEIKQWSITLSIVTVMIQVGEASSWH